MRKIRLEGDYTLKILVHLGLVAISLFIADYLLEGIAIDSWQTMFIAAIILMVINTFIRPVILFFTFPLTLISLGLFVFVVNTFTYWLTSLVIGGFSIDGFLPALIGALITTVLTTVFIRK